MKTIVSVNIVVAMLLAFNCLAEESSQLTGEVGLGVIVFDSSNNLAPTSSKKFLDNLETAAQKELNTIPIVTPHLVYTPSTSSSTSYFLSTRPPIEEAGTFALMGGMTIQNNKFATLDLALFAAPFGEVWKNPYLTGINREETDAQKYGAVVKLNNIASSNVDFVFLYYFDEVESDESGDLMPDLARDGNVYAAKLGYTHNFSRKFSLTPGFTLINGIHDGDANTYIKYSASLGARYTTGNLSLLPRVTYSQTDYDELHPVFNETRDEKSSSLNIVMQYQSLFGCENYLMRGIFGYGKGDANIDFFDTESLMAGLSLVYKF